MKIYAIFVDVVKLAQKFETQTIGYSCVCQITDLRS